MEWFGIVVVVVAFFWFNRNQATLRGTWRFLRFSLMFELGFSWNNEKGRKIAQRVIDRELADRAWVFIDLCHKEDDLLKHYIQRSAEELNLACDPRWDLKKLTKEIPVLEKARKSFDSGCRWAEEFKFVVHPLERYLAPQPPKPPLPF